MSALTAPATPAPETGKFPAFEDSDIKVLEGKTISKGQGWWSAILLVETYGKIQVKLYLWQERNKDGKTEWKRKQHWTVNSYNWEETKKMIEEFLLKRKSRMK